VHLVRGAGASDIWDLKPDGVAMHHMLTGRRHVPPNTNPQNQPTDFPTFGAVLRYLWPGAGCLPSGISLNAPANQVSANNHVPGLLGSANDPLFISRDPSARDFQPFAPAHGSRIDRLASAGRVPSKPIKA
jgi:hypothetical protein